MVDYRRQRPDLDEQCRINADKGWIIENSGGLSKENSGLTQIENDGELTNPEIATAGLALRKLGHQPWFAWPWVT